MSDYEEMLAVFKAGFRARFDAPGLLKPEGDEAIRAGIRAVVDALVGERDLWKSDADRQRRLREDDKAEVKVLRAALQPFAGIKAEDGDTFDKWGDSVVIRCEITVGDLKKARKALAGETT